MAQRITNVYRKPSTQLLIARQTLTDNTEANQKDVGADYERSKYCRRRLMWPTE